MGSGLPGTKRITANLTLTNANTEYSYTFPTGTNQLSYQARTAVDVRVCEVTGKVATPTAPYSTLKAGQVAVEAEIDLTSSLTLYFASSTAGAIMEIVYWTW